MTDFLEICRDRRLILGIGHIGRRSPRWRVCLDAVIGIRRVTSADVRWTSYMGRRFKGVAACDWLIVACPRTGATRATRGTVLAACEGRGLSIARGEIVDEGADFARASQA